MLPNGTGKTRRVAVFAVGDGAREAEEAGADVVGSEDLAARVRDEGYMDFDVAVATPDQMSVVGRLGPVLGPRGLMPNPKSGTVTQDVGRAVEEIKRGKIEYRVDRYGIIHGVIGKKSFDVDQPGRELLRPARGVAAGAPGAGEGPLLQVRGPHDDDGTVDQG